MVNTNFSKHSIVLNLWFPQRWAVVRYQYQLPCKTHHRLDPKTPEKVTKRRKSNKRAIDKKKRNLLRSWEFWEQSCNQECTCHSSSREPICCWCSHGSSSISSRQSPLFWYAKGERGKGKGKREAAFVVLVIWD